MKNFNIPLLLDIYGKLLTKNQYEMTYLYYNEDLSLSEISQHFNISRQGVNDCIKRAEALLMDFEEKLNILKLFKAFDFNIKKMELECLNIYNIISTTNNSNEILKSLYSLQKSLDSLKDNKENIYGF